MCTGMLAIVSKAQCCCCIYAQRMKTRSDVAFGGTSRLEAYTDGVFAIAATLLVLDLSTATFPAIHSDSELWSQLEAMSEKFTSFIISFILISMLWIFHVRQFRQINRSDTVLLWVNSARLMFIVLIPFSTGISSEYSSYLLGKILLPINILLAILLGFLTWVWAEKDHHLWATGPIVLFLLGLLPGISGDSLCD